MLLFKCFLPGEKAPSHRHSQSALRFISKGTGAYTIVQGERIFMEEGDFLITPKNLWHGHEHLGTEPMIMDGCFRYSNSIFNRWYIL